MADDNGLILGMDIGGTNVRSGFVDINKNVKNFKVEKSAVVFRDDPVNDFISYVEDIINTSDVKEQIAAISIGFPSTVSKDYRTIISTPNIKGLNNVNIASMIEDGFGLKALVCKDVSLLLLYDIHINGLPFDSVIAGFYIGTGLGNAIFINGKLLSGKNGVAGELGHIPVYGLKNLCGCGNKGCIETIASGKYLAYLHEQFFSDVEIDDVFEIYGEHSEIKKYVDNLAIPVATEISILDTDYVILGGGVTQMKSFPKEDYERAILHYTRKPYPANNLKFLYSEDSKMNGVIGAGIFGFDNIKPRPFMHNIAD